MQVGLEVDSAEVKVILDSLNRVADVANSRELLDTVGAVIESSTRRRIQIEKQTPEGKPWKPWSANYAKTRHSGHSLLSGHGDLLDTIFHDVDGDAAVIGSPLVYAAIHQFGGEAGRGLKVTIPARAYLGISKQDELDVGDAIIAQLEEAL
ncbi:MAG: phage virion morphogenesis protein [Desulfovibrio sp. S3730MH75]|nr:MAG: phage virion morphogenesis protein [Desulfovibrio sp. S3730MH75]